MIKNCSQCNTEMIQIGDEIPLIKGCVELQKGDGFGIPDSFGSLTAYFYVCPKCGLIQQYVPESLREHLVKIYKKTL